MASYLDVEEPVQTLLGKEVQNKFPFPERGLQALPVVICGVSGTLLSEHACLSQGALCHRGSVHLSWLHLG